MNGILFLLAVIVLVVPCLAQKGIDERLTDENHQRANNLNQLTYYDHKSKCYRSTKTNQKANEYIGLDINNEPYKYVVTVPPLKTILLGDFIEARYISVNKANDPIQFTERDRQRFFNR